MKPEVKKENGEDGAEKKTFVQEGGGALTEEGNR